MSEQGKGRIVKKARAHSELKKLKRSFITITNFNWLSVLVVVIIHEQLVGTRQLE